MSLTERLAAGGGCLWRRDLVTTPADSRVLRRSVAEGRVVRVGRALYALPSARPDVVAARAAGGVLTCMSGAAHLDLPLLARPRVPHIALPAHRRAPDARRGVLHWDSELTPRASSPVAPLGLVVKHASACLPLVEAVALVDAVLNRGLATVAELDVARPRYGKVAFDRVLRLADGRSQSLPETFLRVGLRRAGFTVEPQVHILGLGRVDLLVDGLVAVEVDGFAYHADARQFREDRRRDRVASALAIPVLRFTADDAVRRTEQSVLEVDELVRRTRADGVRPVPPDLIGRAKADA